MGRANSRIVISCNSRCSQNRRRAKNSLASPRVPLTNSCGTPWLTSTKNPSALSAAAIFVTTTARGAAQSTTASSASPVVGAAGLLPPWAFHSPCAGVTTAIRAYARSASKSSDSLHSAKTRSGSPVSLNIPRRSTSPRCRCQSFQPAASISFPKTTTLSVSITGVASPLGPLRQCFIHNSLKSDTYPWLSLEYALCFSITFTASSISLSISPPLSISLRYLRPTQRL
mmetsp:Transcript_2132/g.5895  ORF Transcript_2132/g.5895 Transcript_2132/m.5895 type:complete len:228 (+) Transcript_2132:1107-1790(+)